MSSKRYPEEFKVEAAKQVLEQGTGFQVIEFATPGSGVASPVFRSNTGFVSGGRTAGGAGEFVIPNQRIPSGARQRIVE